MNPDVSEVYACKIAEVHDGVIHDSIKKENTVEVKYDCSHSNGSKKETDECCKVAKCEHSKLSDVPEKCRK